jgi:beta-galactosidase
MPSDLLVEKILEDTVKRAGLWGTQQSLHFPAIVRSGVLSNGHPVHYLLNYSPAPARLPYAFTDGTDLLSGNGVTQGNILSLPAWGVAVVEERGKN